MIPIIHEQDLGYEPPYAVERCCFCRARTPFWTQIPIREPGEQVACCQPCSDIHRVKDVPTKREWCDKERQLEPVPFWKRKP